MKINTIPVPVRFSDEAVLIKVIIKTAVISMFMNC